MRKVYDLLKHIADSLAKIYIIISTCFFCVLIFSAFMQVFTRYVLNSSWPWTEELARYCFIWMIVTGAACGLHRGKLVTVTIVPDRLKGMSRKVLMSFIYLSVMAVSLVLFGTGIRMVMMVGSVPSVIMHLPMGYVHLALPIGGFLMTLACIVGLIETIFEFKDEGPKSAKEEEEAFE